MKTALSRRALGPGVMDGCSEAVAVGLGMIVGGGVGGDRLGLDEGEIDAEGDIEIETEGDGERATEGDGESDSEGALGSRPTQATLRIATKSRWSPRITFITSTSVAQWTLVG